MNLICLVIAAIPSDATILNNQIDNPPSVETLIKQIHSPNAKARSEAIQALVKLGDNAIPELTKALASKKKDTRFAASLVLSHFGVRGKPAVLVLIEFLNEGDSFHQRFAAADALGRLGETALAAAPHLLKRLSEDSRTFLGPHMGPALAKIGPKVAPYILKRLYKSPDKFTETLVHLLAGYDLKYPLELLKHNSSEIRLSALYIFAGKKGHLKLMFKMLDDPAPKVRGLAALSMRSYGDKATAAVGRLRKLLKDKHQIVRSSAAWGLGGIGPSAKEAGDDLAALLKDESVRLEASWALMKIGRTDDAVSGFVRLLDAGDRVKRYTAAINLGQMGPAAKAAIPRLVETVKRDKDDLVRSYASKALAKIGPDARDAVIPISELLYSRDSQAQVAGAEAIVELHPTTKLQIQSVLDAGAKWSMHHAAPAAYVLEKLKLPFATAKPMLIDVLRKSDNARLRILTAHWMVRHGQEQLGFPVFRTMLQTDHAGAVIEAVRSLERLKDKAKPLMDDIARLLKHENRFVRKAAAASLKHISSESGRPRKIETY